MHLNQIIDIDKLHPPLNIRIENENIFKDNLEIKKKDKISSIENIFKVHMAPT